MGASSCKQCGGASVSNEELKIENPQWALKDEAIRVFMLADKDNSGFIDMSELANIRNSKELAEAMMIAHDVNHDGKLSLSEWLDYTKGIFDKKESTCKALLKLYEKQIGQNKDIKAWPLKDEAIRIFKLADKDNSGFIDMNELANVRNSKEFAEAMMASQDTNHDGKLSLPEWLDYLKAIFDQKEATCKALLKLYEKQIGQNKDIKDWPLKDEAVRIFKLADKDNSGFIDMSELANVRNSKEFAETMMSAQDTNHDGKLSLPEWLDYLKAIFEKKEATCKSLLKLYEKQIGQNQDIKKES